MVLISSWSRTEAMRLRAKVDDLDLVRIGTYAQVEGNFRMMAGAKRYYRFTFFLNQISDMRDLINRVVELDGSHIDGGSYIQFYSKELYERLKEMGFERFRARDWNVPRCINSSSAMKREYLRSLVDALGDVDIDRTTPYIRISSVNGASLRRVGEIYGGVFIPHRNDNYLQWYGREALGVGEYLGWRFYCYRNIRGAELVKNARWDSI